MSNEIKGSLQLSHDKSFWATQISECIISLIEK